MNFISNKDFRKLLGALEKDYQVYVPVKKNDQRFYRKYTDLTDEDGITVGEVRPFEPLKAFFTRAREQVAENFDSTVPHAGDKPFAVVGVKSCDLKGFKVQDHVFKNHDYADPFYVKQRENNLIISSDCTLAIDTCFCAALGIEPYPKENFDINLSEVDGGFLVETGSDKGKKIVENNSSLFQKEQSQFVASKEEMRKRVKGEVEENITNNNIPGEDLLDGVIEKKYESKIWEDKAKTCVECGACTAICPTCHCFLLYDQKDEESAQRLRMWDSCMLKRYAAVAGGGNPRPKLWMRLRNRFEKKFDFFPKVADVYACTGCGRCISACPAKIDIREVLKELVND